VDSVSGHECLPDALLGCANHTMRAPFPEHLHRLHRALASKPYRTLVPAPPEKSTQPGTSTCTFGTPPQAGVEVQGRRPTAGWLGRVQRGRRSTGVRRQLSLGVPSVLLMLRMILQGLSRAPPYGPPQWGKGTGRVSRGLRGGWLWGGWGAGGGLRFKRLPAHACDGPGAQWRRGRRWPA